jgi:hypothetical protein
MYLMLRLMIMMIMMRSGWGEKAAGFGSRKIV